jgi:uncharacterized protein involved in cysteine biosynthesis
MDFEANQPHLSMQLFIFILSLADDALLLVLSRVGLHLPWLNWLSPIIITGMILHWCWDFYRHRSHVQEIQKQSEKAV